MQRTTLVHAFAAAVLAIPVASRLHAQDWRDTSEWRRNCEDSGDDRPHVCVIKTFSYRPTGTISVDGEENGAIDIEAWDADTVGVEARINVRGRSENDAQQLADAIRVSVSGGTLHASGPSTRYAWWVQWVLHVPRKSDLDLRTENGPIFVSEVNGRMSLEAVNGPISLMRVSGDVRARTENGPIAVAFAGTSWTGTGLDAETTNGPVSLKLPTNYAAHLETGSENGPLTLRVPMTLQGHINRRIVTDLNGGGVTVRVVTTNGPVIIDRP